MKKQLSEMTLEELWELFPIFLTEHKEYWHEWFLDESKNINKVINNELVRISHIGSTAIPNIYSKPIIDILVEVKDDNLNKYLKIFEEIGYICMSKNDDRVSFNKGYTNNGYATRVFHLHLHKIGDNDELYFRDYFIDNLETAKEYETLKLNLWKKYEHNRDAYTNAKSDFVRKYTEIAKQLYKERYI